MARYIDADVEVSKYVTVWDCDCSEFGEQTVMAVDDLHYLPTADVAQRAKWISVDERLPDQYEDVLGFCHYVYESGGVFDLILTMKLTTDGKFVPFNCSPLKEGIVTHWMPLPEPPKGD